MIVTQQAETTTAGRDYGNHIRQRLPQQAELTTEGRETEFESYVGGDRRSTRRFDILIHNFRQCGSRLLISGFWFLAESAWTVTSGRQSRPATFPPVRGPESWKWGLRARVPWVLPGGLPLTPRDVATHGSSVSRRGSRLHIVHFLI